MPVSVSVGLGSAPGMLDCAPSVEKLTKAVPLLAPALVLFRPTEMLLLSVRPAPSESVRVTIMPSSTPSSKNA